MKTNVELTPMDFREKILTDLETKKSDFVVLICAVLIASIGLNMNSAVVVVGAMLISPLMVPILSIGYGLSVLDLHIVKKAAHILFLEVMLSLLVACLYFLLSPISYASSEIISRTSPTIWDVLIAFSGGTAGVIGVKRNNNNIISGVAIATALIPPICTMGYSVVTLNWKFLLGSTYLFIINCAFIIIATFLSIRIMKFPVQMNMRDKKISKINFLLLVTAIIIIVPSLISAASLTNKSVRNSAISQLINNEFAEHIIINQNYNRSQDILTLTLSGKVLEESDITTIEERLPNYGLKKTQLNIIQIEKLTDLDDAEFAKYMNKYIQEQMEQNINKKNIDQQNIDTETSSDTKSSTTTKSSSDTKSSSTTKSSSDTKSSTDTEKSTYSSEK